MESFFELIAAVKMIMNPNILNDTKKAFLKQIKGLPLTKKEKELSSLLYKDNGEINNEVLKEVFPIKKQEIDLEKELKLLEGEIGLEWEIDLENEIDWGKDCKLWESKSNDIEKVKKEEIIEKDHFYMMKKDYILRLPYHNKNFLSRIANMEEVSSEILNDFVLYFDKKLYTLYKDNKLPKCLMRVKYIGFKYEYYKIENYILPKSLLIPNYILYTSNITETKFKPIIQTKPIPGKRFSMMTLGKEERDSLNVRCAARDNLLFVELDESKLDEYLKENKKYNT